MPSSEAKRLAKRQKRKVTRAREKLGSSEPDLRTHEQIKAAREASRPTPPSFQHGPALAIPEAPAAAKSDDILPDKAVPDDAKPSHVRPDHVKSGQVKSRPE